MNNPITIGVTLVFVLLGMITFAWPLWGVHQLLVREKTRVQGERARRMETACADLRGTEFVAQQIGEAQWTRSTRQWRVW